MLLRGDRQASILSGNTVKWEVNSICRKPGPAHPVGGRPSVDLGWLDW
jgi:hypothetical protein